MQSFLINRAADHNRAATHTNDCNLDTSRLLTAAYSRFV
jgi:hypothetical protein